MPDSSPDSAQRRLAAQGAALDDALAAHGGDRELVERLRQRLKEVAAREDLSAASGISDPEILERLASLGIRADTLAALTLFPLVQVAWADGRMEPRERDAILDGAVSSGMRRGSPSFELLGIWIEDRPPDELARAWRDLVAGLGRLLRPEERVRLRANVVARARAVAEAAGDLLGEGSRISPEEESVLEEVERAFGA